MQMQRIQREHIHTHRMNLLAERMSLKQCQLQYSKNEHTTHANNSNYDQTTLRWSYCVFSYCSICLIVIMYILLWNGTSKTFWCWKIYKLINDKIKFWILYPARYSLALFVRELIRVIYNLSLYLLDKISNIPTLN